MKFLRLFVVIHFLVTSRASTASRLELQKTLQDLASLGDKELMSKCRDLIPNNATNSTLTKDKRVLFSKDPFILFGHPGNTVLGGVGAVMSTGIAALSVADLILKPCKSKRALPDIAAKAKQTTLKRDLLGADGVGGPVGFRKHRTMEGRETKEDLKQRCSRIFNLIDSIYRMFAEAAKKN